MLCVARFQTDCVSSTRVFLCRWTSFGVSSCDGTRCMRKALLAKLAEVEHPVDRAD